jgi:tRNA(Ile)-lysidine synthase
MSGMPVCREVDGVTLVRPLLDLSRECTRQACLAAGLTPWDDPHNADPAFTRSRVRASVLPALVAALGPAVVANLARTAGLLAADVEALDALAADALAAARAGAGLGVPVLAGLAPALRSRALHAWCRELGAPGSALSHRHVAALDALVVAWRGQGPVWLPGRIAVARRADALVRV